MARSPEYWGLLEKGWEQQDLVAHELYLRGWPVINYQSKVFQAALGENTVGMEIKLDQRWQETGNLCLEGWEKNDPSNPHFVKSGISIKSRFFCIGDSTRLFIFGTGMLRRLVKSGKCKKYQTETSKGWLLPVAEAEKYAIEVIEVSPETQTILRHGEWLKEYNKPAAL